MMARRYEAKPPTVLGPLADGRVYLTLDSDLLHDLSTAATGERRR
jgi:hypothetical protein